MSDIFKQDLPCDECGAVFPREQLKQYRRQRLCSQCYQVAKNTPSKTDDRASEAGSGKNKGSPALAGEFEVALTKIGNLEGKVEALQKEISVITAVTAASSGDIAAALKIIADQFKSAPADPDALSAAPLPPESPGEQIPPPPLPVPEFQEPLEAEIRYLPHTQVVLDWGIVIDLAVARGWHRSYHTFLAFLRHIDSRFSKILAEIYSGQSSLHRIWIDTVSRHVPLLQGKGLRWRDFIMPDGTGSRRNPDARWQQAVIDTLICRQNQPTPSRELADSLLPDFQSTSTEPVRRRMLQNVVANLARQGILVVKDLRSYPKKFWIPDCRQ